MKKSDVLRELIKNLKDHVDPLDKPKMRIFISDELSLEPHDRNLISNFCKYAAAQMNLEQDYKCYISSSRKRSGIKTTGICLFDRGEIKVYGSKRSLADILRSIAHEMFHLRQNELGVIPERIKNKHFTEPLEWHANIAAGSILSKFAITVGRDKVYR
jgi:hypothetical protein